MKKLLFKTVKPIMVYSLLILAISIPVYYLLLDSIWKDEIDEKHEVMRNKIERELNRIDSNRLDEVIGDYNLLNIGAKLTRIKPNERSRDSIYVHSKYDSGFGDEEFFRVYESKLKIHDRFYLLVLETNMEESEDTLWSITYVTSAFFILLLVGFILIIRILSKKIWNPFFDALEKLKQFDLLRHDKIELSETNIYEFNELKSVLDRLISKSVVVFKSQKEFAENASHELQTPLAILKSKIDLLLQDGKMSPEQLEQISALNASVTRMSRINKNLLLLAKLENPKYAEETTLLNPSDITDELLEYLAPFIDEGKLNVIKLYSKCDVIRANKVLLETLLLNLLLNAARHSTDQGVIKIEIISHKFRIYNSGTTALNKETLFKRFAAASSVTPGSGLGLAIVKEICKRYNWLITYEFESGNHVFEVSFRRIQN